MSNSDTMSMGGASSAIGPLLMRRAAPWRVSAQDIITPEQNLYKDNLFSSVREQLSNLSFSLDGAQVSPGMDSNIRAARERLSQAVTFKRPELNMRERAAGGLRSVIAGRNTG